MLLTVTVIRLWAGSGGERTLRPARDRAYWARTDAFCNKKVVVEAEVVVVVAVVVVVKVLLLVIE